MILTTELAWMKTAEIWNKAYRDCSTSIDMHLKKKVQLINRAIKMIAEIVSRKSVDIIIVDHFAVVSDGYTEYQVRTSRFVAKGVIFQPED